MHTHLKPWVCFSFFFFPFFFLTNIYYITRLCTMMMAMMTATDGHCPHYLATSLTCSPPGPPPLPSPLFWCINTRLSPPLPFFTTNQPILTINTHFFLVFFFSLIFLNYLCLFNLLQMPITITTTSSPHITTMAIDSHHHHHHHHILPHHHNSHKQPPPPHLLTMSPGPCYDFKRLRNRRQLLVQKVALFVHILSSEECQLQLVLS